MWSDLLSLMWMPFLMCLVLTGIHAYLGFHVLSREVIFVDSLPTTHLGKVDRGKLRAAQ